MRAEEMENIDMNQPELAEEELEQVNGGGSSFGNCPHCHKYVTIYTSGNTHTCASCGGSWTTAY